MTELTIGEDCSIPSSELGRAGRRGLVGMLFVAKVAGALAERGQSLNSVAQCAEIVTNNIATYAVGLTACALPGFLLYCFIIIMIVMLFSMHLVSYRTQFVTFANASIFLIPI